MMNQGSSETTPDLNDLFVSMTMPGAEAEAVPTQGFSAEAQATLKAKLKSIDLMHTPSPVSPTQIVQGIGRTIFRG